MPVAPTLSVHTHQDFQSQMQLWYFPWPALVLILSLLPPLRAEMPCVELAESALKNFERQEGTETLSCNDNLGCDPDKQDTGINLHEKLVYCISVGGAKACTPSRYPPCSAYSGKKGAVFGASPVATNYSIPLLSPDVQEQLEVNWSSLSDWAEGLHIGLCCSSANLSDAPPSYVANFGTIVDPVQDPCSSHEYPLDCTGTTTLGLCSVFIDSLAVTGRGHWQHYFINFESNATHVPPSTPHIEGSRSTSISTGEPASSTTSTHSTSSISPATASVKRSSNTVLIAVPIASALTLLLFVALCVGARRRSAMKAAANRAHARIDPLAPPAASSSENASNIAVRTTLKEKLGASRGSVQAASDSPASLGQVMASGETVPPSYRSQRSAKRV